jgi:hypothetical protein
MGMSKETSGRKGGERRAELLSPSRRSEIARKAAVQRWAAQPSDEQDAKAVRREIITLDEGEVVLTFPEKISAASFDELKDRLDIFIRKMKKRAGYIDIELGDDEADALMEPLGGQGGFQSFLSRLQRNFSPYEGTVSITPEDLERIKRYAFGYGNGGWEGRLKAIFSRSLGQKLDGKV